MHSDSSLLDARPHGPALFQGRHVVKRFDTAELHPAAVHEAGHLTLARLLGEQFTSAAVHDNGGHVELLRNTREIVPRHVAMMAIAGEAAERLFCSAGSSGRSDERELARVLPLTTESERAKFRSETERLLLRHRAEVLETARQLTAEGTITPSRSKSAAGLESRPVNRVSVKSRCGLGV